MTEPCLTPTVSSKFLEPLGKFVVTWLGEVCRSWRALSGGKSRMLGEAVRVVSGRERRQQHGLESPPAFPALPGSWVLPSGLQAHHGQGQVRLRRQISERLGDP